MDRQVCQHAPEVGDAAEAAFASGGLTPREVDATRSIVLGITAAEAADLMHISPSTVANYRRRACDKLGLDGTKDLFVCYRDASREGGELVAKTRDRLLELGLSESQSSVLAELVCGSSTAEVARAHAISEGTVGSMRARGYEALGVHSTRELRGLLSQEECREAHGAANWPLPRRLRKWMAAYLLIVLLLVCSSIYLCARFVLTREVRGVMFPVNLSGQTYGSIDDAVIPEGIPPRDEFEFMPDLVAIQSADGEEGYAKVEELAARSLGSKAPLLLYRNDGKTVVGQLD